MERIRIRIGIDTGGTFTDFVVIRNGGIRVFKRLSTPTSPETAILEGLEHAIARGQEREIIHGSTVATNALLERKGARTALITTEGFEDILEIGRQTRRELYNIDVERPAPLIPDTLRIGMHERVRDNGSVLRPIDAEELRALAERLRREGVESVAVCLLFSFANPDHERKIGQALSGLQVPVSLSSEILPEYREFERTSTTAINAYLAPVMGGYLGRLEQRLAGESLRVMQSNGGAVRTSTVAAQPVRTILSGPAGGVSGAFEVARAAGYDRIITFDMGGTSTDVSLCDGEVGLTREGEIDGLPVGVWTIDVHSVGAGGGSIAEVDAGGALTVGPESAGADPGPICYGKGARLTVTDANVILGRLLPRFFLGGEMPLHVDRIGPALKNMAWTRRWRTAEEMADGVIQVVNGNMERAIRLVSVERGHDPAELTLVTFGGAGGLHAADLARSLGIPRVIVPQFPGALSALGLLLADARKDYSRSLLADLREAKDRVARMFRDMHETGMKELAEEGFTGTRVRVVNALDLRYRGQSYELTIPFSRAGMAARFHEAHQRRYGYANPDKAIEVVNVRTTLWGRVSKPKLPRAPKTRGRAQALETRNVWIDGRYRRTAVYDRSALTHGHTIEGPAIVGEYSSTTLVPPGFRCDVDPLLNLVIRKFT